MQENYFCSVADLQEKSCLKIPLTVNAKNCQLFVGTLLWLLHENLDSVRVNLRLSLSCKTSLNCRFFHNLLISHLVSPEDAH